MSPRLDVAWSTDTGTCELARVYRGPAIFGAETVELLVPTKPEIEPAPRWSLLARVLVTALVVDVAGLLYVVATQ